MESHIMKVPITFMRRKSLGTTQCLNKWLSVYGLLVCGLSWKMENNSSITKFFKENGSHPIIRRDW